MLTTKETVLGFLEENRGHPISGAAIARSLNISRAAVWKAIEELRKAGHSIDAATNRGYSLAESSDLLSVEGILLESEGLPLAREQIHIFKTIDSTNHIAKKMAVEGAPHGSVFLAEEQTQGRGRRGRSFCSPSGSGLYMSILLRPEGNTEQAILTTSAAAVAVSRALSKLTGLDAKIKWVNDIFIHGKKVCGILTEAVSDFESGSIEALVLGIGINVSTKEEAFPEDVRAVAGSLDLETGVKPSRNALAAAVLREVFALAANPKPEEFMEEYRSRCFLLGQDILVLPGGADSYEATAISIDDRGALIVETKKGKRQTLNSGEVSVRPR